MPAPTLTEIVGVPSLPPGATNLQITVTLDPPYQGGPLIGLSASQYDGVRNTDGTRWVFETTNNTPFAFPMARKDAICPPPDGWMRAIITYTLGGKGYRAELKPLRPIAGDDGTLDLSANQFPGGVISITSLSGLIADTTAAKTGALAARDAANAAAAAVPGQVATGLAPVAPALAAMTQAVADNAQATALVAEITQAQGVRRGVGFVGGVEMIDLTEIENGPALYGMDGGANPHFYGTEAHLGPVSFQPAEIGTWVDGVRPLSSDEDSAGASLGYTTADGVRVYPGGVISAGIPVQRVFARRDVEVVGDSLFELPDGAENTFSYLLAEKLGDDRSIINHGVIASQSMHIAALYGAYPVSVSVPGGVIPADHGYKIIVTVGLPLLFGAGPRQVPATISGIRGLLTTLNDNAQASEYRFQRYVTGRDVAVPAAQNLIFDIKCRDWMPIFCLGHNNPWMFDQVVADNEAVIAAYRARVPGGKFVLLSLQPGRRPDAGGDRNVLMGRINTEMQRRYPVQFVDRTTKLLNADGWVKPELLLAPAVDDIHLGRPGQDSSAHDASLNIIWQESMQ